MTRNTSMLSRSAPRTALLLATLCCAAAPAHAGSPDLLGLMSRMQTFTHKLQLSLEARNAPLADFYIHEIEASAETTIESVSEYGGHPIGQLVRDMLLPAIERLEDPLEARDWAATDAPFSDLLKTCNACHKVTGHAYIHIAPASGNPFAQDFAAPKQ